MLTKVDKNREKALNFAIVIFFLIQSVNGYFIQMTIGRICDIISFGGVVLAFLFALALFNKSIDWLLCALGLFFTVIADWNLVILNPMRQMPAMYAFSLVQIFYFLRIYRVHKKTPDGVGRRRKSLRRIHITVRVLAITVALLICRILLGEGADALSMIAMFYYANLLCNVLFSFVEFRKMPCFAIGLLCFALCDLFVGLGMIDQYITVEYGSLIYKLTHTDLNMAWVFYVPSYTLIAISAKGKMASLANDAQ